MLKVRWLRIRGWLAASLVVVTAAAGLASALAPASASAASLSNCESSGYGYLCLFQNWYYSGTMWRFNNQNSWSYVGASANDNSISLANYRNLYVSWVSQDWPNSATQACIPVNYGYPELSAEWYPVGTPSGSAAQSISSYELSNWRTSCPAGSEFKEGLG
jgi:Peptidase inhibitor family I36